MPYRWSRFPYKSPLFFSTTHSIIGGIVGYGLVYAGTGIVDWGKLAQVVLSWILSPIFGAIVAFFVFKAVRRSILVRSDPVKSARVWAPFWIGLAFVVIGTMFYIKVLHGKDLLKGILFYGVPMGIVIFAFSYLLIRVHFKPSDPYVGVESIFRKV